MKRLIFLSVLFSLASINPTIYAENKFSSLNVATAAAAWVAVAPAVSFFVNTTPAFWPTGEFLCGNDLPSRYALGGIVGGTVATLAALYIYSKFESLRNTQLETANEKANETDSCQNSTLV